MKLGLCCRDKLQASEGKLRSAIQDKGNVVSEKATIDRQLKALQAQTGKLTKVTQTSPENNNVASSSWVRYCRASLYESAA